MKNGKTSKTRGEGETAKLGIQKNATDREIGDVGAKLGYRCRVGWRRIRGEVGKEDYQNYEAYQNSGAHSIWDICPAREGGGMV